MAKPYSPGHIGAVASNFTEMRLAGAVKQRLVELVCEEIERLVPDMEQATLAQDAELDPEFSEKFLRFIIDEVIRHHEKARAST